MYFKANKIVALKRIILITLLGAFIYSCTALKNNTTALSSKDLDTFVSNEPIEVDLRWAEPQMTMAMMQVRNMGLAPVGSTAGRIDISGQASFLRISKDSVSGRLPFFGERQFGSTYNTIDNGINFEGIPKNYKITDGKRSSKVISFTVKDSKTKAESYNVRLVVYTNLSCLLDVNSSHRFPISYRGRILEGKEVTLLSSNDIN